MSVTAASLRKSGRYRIRAENKPPVTRPLSLAELQQTLDPNSNFSPPFRPRGAGSAATECNSASAGTAIDMTAFDRIIDIDSVIGQVTVQAGVRLGALSDALAAEGMELDGSHDLLSRTVGGAVAGGCNGPAIGDDHGLFAAQVISMKLVTPNGGLLNVNGGQKSLLNVFRLSYGMLGVIYELTLKVRPVATFNATHRRCTLAQFSNAVDKLLHTNVGLRFLFLPFSDAVYLDLRRFDIGRQAKASIPWKIKDWGESTVLPNVFKSLHRVIPAPGVRFRIIDELSKLTQGLVSNGMASSGSTATAQSGGRDLPRSMQYCTWFFPAADFSIVIQAYKDFCQRIWDENGFRCDMPTVGYRLSRDRSAVLSPSFDEPMIALRAMSTQAKGWDDFVIDFSDFAKNWGATPVFNQTREVEPAYAKDIFRKRLEYFRRARRQIDPEQRMMNPFLSQYFL
jgi:hypothetical protein